MHLTDKPREIAEGVLPKVRYSIMTQQSIVDRLGSQEQAVQGGYMFGRFWQEGECGL